MLYHNTKSNKVKEIKQVADPLMQASCLYLKYWNKARVYPSRIFQHPEWMERKRLYLRITIFFEMLPPQAARR